MQVPFKLPKYGELEPRQVSNAGFMGDMFKPTQDEREAPAVYKDDRDNLADASEYTNLVGGRDSFLSGWGQAPNGSYAYWACRDEDVEKVREWVDNRDEFRRVEVVEDIPKRGKGTHTSVYVVREGHPALV